MWTPFERRLVAIALSTCLPAGVSVATTIPGTTRAGSGNGGRLLSVYSMLRSTLAIVAMAIVCGEARSMPIMLATPDCGDACAIGLHYYGGPVMTSPVDVFSIWYGDWGADPALTILPTFFRSLAGSDYMNIAALYADAQGNPVTNDVSFGGSVTRSAYRGTSISRATVGQIVLDAQADASLPSETSAVYFVFSAPNVLETSGSCGYHGNVGSALYAWINPNPRCDFLGGVTGDLFADTLTETSSHELMEALTDPFIRAATSFGPPLAWYSPFYGEIGDMCEQSNFSANLNGNQFDVQSIFVRDTSSPQGGFCASANVVATAISEPPTALLLSFALVLFAMQRPQKRGARQLEGSRHAGPSSGASPADCRERYGER